MSATITDSQYSEQIAAYLAHALKTAKDVVLDGVKIDPKLFPLDHLKFDKRVIHLSNRVVIPPEVPAGGLDELIALPLSKDTLTVRVGMRDPVDIDPANYNWREHVETTVSHDPERGTMVYHTIALPKAIHDLYYTGLINGFSWPLNHQRLDIANAAYRLFDDAKQEVFGRKQEEYAENKFNNEVEATEKAGRVAAESILELTSPTQKDTVVVHDPHFYEVGKFLNELNVDCPKSFFLHTPAPDDDLYRNLDLKCQQDWLMNAMLSLFHYNLVGVQAERDFENIWKLVGDNTPPRNPDLYQPYKMMRENESESGSVNCSTAIGILPVVGHNEVYAMQASAKKNYWRAKWFLGAKGFKAPKIFTWGRLDYSKNLVNMLRAVGFAVERLGVPPKAISFLMQAAYGRKDVEAFQQEHENVTKAHREVMDKHGANGLNVDLYTDRVARPICLALARMSRVGLIVPLIDGFNLTATEYIAAQNPEDPGVLILGKNAGAAPIIGDGAIQVNAADPREIARAIKKALGLSLEERKAMYQRALQRINEHSNLEWQESVIGGALKWYVPNQSLPSREAGDVPGAARNFAGPPI